MAENSFIRVRWLSGKCHFFAAYLGTGIGITLTRQWLQQMGPVQQLRKKAIYGLNLKLFQFRITIRE